MAKEKITNEDLAVKIEGLAVSNKDLSDKMEGLAVSNKDLSTKMEGLVDTIEDLAASINREFDHVYEKFDKVDKKIDATKVELKNDIHGLANRISNIKIGQKEFIEKLDADTFALKHVAQDHEKRITVLESKPA